MTAQAVAPETLSTWQRRASLPYFGAELADISAADAAPTRTDPWGVAVPCRGLNAQVAGLVKVDLADGTSGITLAVVAGSNSIAATKVYKAGTDVGLVGKLAFLF